jgi:hypothetical protein
MGVDYYSCDECGECRHSDSLRECSILGCDVTVCEEDCADTAGRMLTDAAYGGLKEKFESNMKRANDAYAHEKACILADMAGKPRPAALPAEDSEDEDEDEADGKTYWYCNDCTSTEVAMVRPWASESDILQHLLQQLNTTRAAAEAEVIRGKILADIERDNVRMAQKMAAEAKQAEKKKKQAQEKAQAEDAKPGQKRKRKA